MRSSFAENRLYLIRIKKTELKEFTFSSVFYTSPHSRRSFRDIPLKIELMKYRRCEKRQPAP